MKNFLFLFLVSLIFGCSGSSDSSTDIDKQSYYRAVSGQDTCSLDITYEYSSGLPLVTGLMTRNGVQRNFDITLISISKDDFAKEMTSSKIDFLNFYKKQSAFDQKNKLDLMCEDLLDQKCATAF